MRKLNEIIIHCSATPPAMDIGVEEIREWHVEGNGWSDIGYHYVIRRNGVVETGRSMAIAGAHTRGHNDDTVGICLVGGADTADFTLKQYLSLDALVTSLQRNREPMKLSGHNEYSTKACPRFDVKEFFK